MREADEEAFQKSISGIAGEMIKEPASAAVLRLSRIQMAPSEIPSFLHSEGSG
jgi:hypothetical protein